MNIVISSGHGKYIRGASGYLDEVDEARRVVDRVAELWRTADIGVKVFHDNTSTSQNQNLNTIVNYHNAQTRDLDVSVHFNAYQTTSKPMGVEVLYTTQSALASELSAAMASVLGLPNRGGKYRSDLFFLNSTEEPAILIETCFVDSSADEAAYLDKFEAVCQCIAEVVGNITIGEGPPETEPPPTEPPPQPTEDNRIEITSAVEGHVTIYVNNTLVRGHDGPCEHVVKFTVSAVGNATLVINGEEFHNAPQAPTEPEIASNHCNIEATVFGGSDDPNNSAYPPYALLHGDSEDFVALPYSFNAKLFPNDAPKVRVYCGELSAIGVVADKGPWTTDDVNYVDGAARPIAETCCESNEPLPSGPNAGRIPSNKAGIDLSPHLASKIGVKGKGVVSWEFVSEDQVS
jgi:N-acetylmuramoyl-L-alanine amidase